MSASKDPEKRARQRANLRPAKPGEVRNPAGHNGRFVAAAILRHATPANVEQLAELAWSRALKGEPFFVTFVTEQTQGKLTERTELSGPDGAPLSSAPVAGLTTEQLRALVAMAEQAGERPSMSQSVGAPK